MFDAFAPIFREIDGEEGFTRLGGLADCPECGLSLPACECEYVEPDPCSPVGFPLVAADDANGLGRCVADTPARFREGQA